MWEIYLPKKSAETLRCLPAQATPDLRIESAGMCRALFEVYMGSKPVIPEAKAEWARGARALLETEEVRRATRKSGGS